jgi:hypothetical protein
VVALGSFVVGAPRTTRPWPPDRIFEQYGDALYDFALSVTGEPGRAVAAVREAVLGALECYGPGLAPAVFFGCVFAVAVKKAEPPPPLGTDLIEPGSGSPDELQRLARVATLLLDPVQRGCLDLALRHGLEGEALSEALGVTPGLASISVQAATDQAEHVIGAVLLARLGRNDCAGLGDLTLEAVGAPAEKLAVAVVEHVETCSTCSDRRRALVPVTTLLAGVPAVPAPPELKKIVELRRRTGIVRALRPAGRPTGHRTASRPAGCCQVPRPLTPGAAAPGLPVRSGVEQRGHRRRRGLVAGVAGVVIVAALVAVLWPRRSGEIARTAAPGGRLTVDAAPVDFGAAGVQGAVRITNAGREPLVFETRAAVPWISFAGGEGTLDPGASVVVTAALDRSRAPEGAADSEIRVQSNGGSAVVPVRAVVERAPELSGLEVTPQSVVVRRCPGSTPAQVRAAIVEESGLGPVELHWRVLRRGMVEQVSPMSGEAQTSYLGALGPFDTPGDVQWWVSAVDIRNNRAASPPQVLRVASC